MTHRTFRDSTGCDWAVWDVYPLAPERRTLQRRQLVDASGRLLDRRRGRERRQRRTPRAILGAGYDSGWLCFESAEIRRRVAPIPAGWTSWSERELEDCCRQASPVVRRSIAS